LLYPLFVVGLLLDRPTKFIYLKMKKRTRGVLKRLEVPRSLAGDTSSDSLDALIRAPLSKTT